MNKTESITECNRHESHNMKLSQYLIFRFPFRVSVLPVLIFASSIELILYKKFTNTDDLVTKDEK